MRKEYPSNKRTYIRVEPVEAFPARLRPHLCKTQWASGGASDFLDAGYLITASTSYLVLSLQAGLEPAELTR